MTQLFKLILLLTLVSLVSCGKSDNTAMPPAQELTRDAIGYYCMMTVVEHQGPKGQIILRDMQEPLWFTSVRDTLSFTGLARRKDWFSGLIDVSDHGARLLHRLR